ELLQTLAEELGDRIVPVTADVVDDADRIRLIEIATETGGGSIDVLVNNAGLVRPGPAETEPFESFEYVVDLNLNAVFRLCQLAYEPLRSGTGGAIVNVASMLGQLAGTPIKQA